MKFLLLILTYFACINVSCYGQSTPGAPKIDYLDTTNIIFYKVDIDIFFPGGDSALSDFIKQNLKTKVPADNGAPAGSYIVIVKFIVWKDGSFSDVTCDTDPGYGMCEEALRVIKKIKKWIPAKKRGFVVNSHYRKWITFRVE